MLSCRRNHIHELRGGVASVVEIVTQVQPDAIFHLAAVYAEPVSADCVLSMLDGNLSLGACLLFAATRCAMQPVFINTGTYWQFDKESMYSPNSLYAATKQAFQDLLHFYRERMGTAAVTLIYYDTFGEGDTRQKLWQKMTSAAAGTSFRLSLGEQTIHLVHVEDIVRAFIRAAELLHEGQQMAPMYTVQSDSPRTLRSLVEELNSRGNLGLDLQWGAIPYWEGQVVEPWVGEMLPGWKPEVEVMSALLRLANSARSESIG